MAALARHVAACEPFCGVGNSRAKMGVGSDRQFPAETDGLAPFIIRQCVDVSGTIHVSALTAVTDGGASDADIRSFGAGVLTTEAGCWTAPLAGGCEGHATGGKSLAPPRLAKQPQKTGAPALAPRRTTLRAP